MGSRPIPRCHTDADAPYEQGFKESVEVIRASAPEAWV